MAAEEMESERKATGANAPSPPQEHRRNATGKQPAGQEEGNEYLSQGVMEKERVVLQTGSGSGMEDVELSPTPEYVDSGRPAVAAVT